MVPACLAVHYWSVHPLGNEQLPFPWHYLMSLSLARFWLSSEGIIWNLLVELFI